MGPDAPLAVIAGPCAIESLDMCLRQMISVELGYVDFGKLDNDIDLFGGGALTGTTEIDGVYGSLNGRVFVTESLFLRAHVGVVSWDAEFSGAVPGTGVSFKDGDEDLFYGLEIGTRIGDQLEARGGVSRYELGDLDADVISINLIWNVDFGTR